MLTATLTLTFGILTGLAVAYTVSQVRWMVREIRKN